MRTEIALLQNVRVASPCAASWEAMSRVDGDRVRFCEGCQKRVYNLSALGQAEAEGLLRAHEGHLCVRYYRRADGTILTSDCPIGLQAARQLVLTRVRVSLGLCFLLCMAFAAQRSAQRTVWAPTKSVQRLPAPPHVEPLMGAVALQPPAPEPVTGSVTFPSKPLTPREEIGDVTEIRGEVDIVQGRTVPQLNAPQPKSR